MTTFLRRHPFAAFAGALVLLAAAGVALAPWWIDLGPVRRKIERAASSALAGTLSYERMDLSWLPRPQVVVRGVKLSMPGVRGTLPSLRVQPALLSLLRGRVVLTKLRVEGLDLAVMAGASKEQKPAFPPSYDWKQLVSSVGPQTLDIDVDSSRVVLSREGHGTLALEGLRVEGALRASDGRAVVTFSRLSLESPHLFVEGSLRADAGVPSVEAAARGSALDVTDVRVKLLAFAGDDPLIAAIFAILRGGTLTSFSFSSDGKAPADLGVLERMSIRAVLKDGKVRVPGPDLDLADVSADVVLEGGALTADNAAARVGKSRAEGGKVLVGLAKGDDHLRVEAQVKVDLAEAPAILARVIPSPSFHREVALVEGLQGSATGRITIGDLKSAPTSVDVSEMRFTANYRRLPWPVEVNRGRFFFDGTRVGVSGLSGSLGRSTFSGLAARVRLGTPAVLESASGAIDVSLEDFLEGVRTRPEAERLARSIRRLAGTLRVGVRRVSGSLARLDEASVDASGTFEEILFDSPSSLPPLSIPSGRFAVSDDGVRVENVEARVLDASLRVTGSWNGYRKGAGTIEATAEGEVGAEAIRWGWGRASLPAEFRPAAPIAVNGLRFTLAGDDALSLAGGFVVANGPRLTLDLARDGKGMDVRDLTVADGDSLASMAFRAQEGAFDVRFQGRFAAATVAKLFEERGRRGGGIEGSFRAHVPAGNLGLLTAEGTLTATDLDVPTPAGLVTVERLDVRATQNRFDVASSSLVLDEQRFSAAGGATFQDEAIVLDMDVATGDLSWAQVEKALGRLEDAKEKAAAAATPVEAKAVETTPKTAAPASLAISGDVRVSLGSFSYGDFVWKPVLADVRLEKDAVTAAVRSAEVCGISTTGEARVLPGGGVALEARVDAAGPDISVPLTCLGLENVGMTGSYEASAEVRGEGAVSDLPRAVQGPLKFKFVKGRIGKATLLTRILGVVNSTDVFAGKSGARVGEAIPYESITIDGELAEGKVSIREATFVAPSLTMAATGTVNLLDRSLDLMVLSHPLSTFDKVVQAVPVVRTVLGRGFLSVAVKVTGSIGDPKARVTPARDVGKGLIGILERTVTLPVKVFDPPSQERQ